jgi:DNA repair exonuclease SbcCD ATPase subunit
MKSYLIFSFYFSLQISKLETDIQRLNQSIEKQKNSEMQLRTQLSDMKNVRKELEDLRAENSALQTKYVRFNLWLKKIFNGLFRYEAVNTQRNRDKQRMADLEKNTNDEKQNKQRLELQIKTEKTLMKKLQDDLTKLSLAPLRFVLSFSSVRILR